MEDLFRYTEVDPYSIGKVVNYDKQAMIFNEGSLCSYIGIVLSGTIVITCITCFEKEEVITCLKKGDVFGDLLIFASDTRYLGNITALTKASVLLISKDKLINLFMNNQIFLENYLTYISNKAQSLKGKEKLLSHKKIEDRIMYYLTTRKDCDNIVKIKSVTDLAKHLSLPRVSVSRALSNLEKKGFIIKNPSYILLLRKE